MLVKIKRQGKIFSSSLSSAIETYFAYKASLSSFEEKNMIFAFFDNSKWVVRFQEIYITQQLFSPESHSLIWGRLFKERTEATAYLCLFWHLWSLDFLIKVSISLLGSACPLGDRQNRRELTTFFIRNIAKLSSTLPIVFDHFQFKIVFHVGRLTRNGILALKLKDKRVFSRPFCHSWGKGWWKCTQRHILKRVFSVLFLHHYVIALEL